MIDRTPLNVTHPDTFNGGLVVPTLADKLRFESWNSVRLPKIEIDEVDANVSDDETATLPLTTSGEAVETVRGTVTCKYVEFDNHTPSTQLKDNPGDTPEQVTMPSSDGGSNIVASFMSTASKI